MLPCTATVPFAVVALTKVYTGNGQTYALYVLYYFLALYVASGGAQQFWMSN